MAQGSIREYEFEGFRVEVASRRLCKADSTPVELTARGFDVLLYLLQHPGEDVSKERLLEAAWPKLVVDENNLNQAITALRRALADRRDEPRYIMTVAGRGYRFVATVIAREAVDEPESAPRRSFKIGVADRRRDGGVECDRNRDVPDLLVSDTRAKSPRWPCCHSGQSSPNKAIRRCSLGWRMRSSGN